jgi:hypothetical protein
LACKISYENRGKIHVRVGTDQNLLFPFHATSVQESDVQEIKTVKFWFAASLAFILPLLLATYGI